MENLAVILRQRRRQRHLGLGRAAAELAIPEHYLRALENGDFQKIPAGYRRLYLRDYARLLGLNEEHALALYRRDFRGSKTVRPLLREQFFSSWEKLLANWQQLFLIAFIFLLAAYLGFEYYRFQRPPSLVLRPLPQVSHQPTVMVEGTARRAAIVRLNGQPLILDENGHFQKKAVLLKGDNWLDLEAISPAGKKVELKKKVVFRP